MNSLENSGQYTGQFWGTTWKNSVSHVSELEINESGLEVFVPYSCYADLAGIYSAWIEKRQHGEVIALLGRSEWGKYHVWIVLSGARVVSRRVMAWDGSSETDLYSGPGAKFNNSHVDYDQNRKEPKLENSLQASISGMRSGLAKKGTLHDQSGQGVTDWQNSEIHSLTSKGINLDIYSVIIKAPPSNALLRRYWGAGKADQVRRITDLVAGMDGQLNIPRSCFADLSCVNRFSVLGRAPDWKVAFSGGNPGYRFHGWILIKDGAVRSRTIRYDTGDNVQFAEVDSYKIHSGGD